MVRRIFALLALFALAAFSRPALAQSYSMSYGLESNAWIGAVNLSWSETVNNQTVNYSANGVAMGPQIISFNGTPPTGYSTSNEAYCIDLYHWDQSPSTVYVDPVVSISNLADDNASVDGLTQAQYNANLDAAAYLYQTYNPIVQSATGEQQQIDGAALQWAIWDEMAGPSFTVANAGVNSTEFLDAQQLAQTWYGSVGNKVGNGTLFQIDRTLQPTAGQDLLGPAVAPEGSSLVLLVFGLAAPLGLLAWQARRRSANRVS